MNDERSINFNERTKFEKLRTAEIDNFFVNIYFNIIELNYNR